MNIHRADPAIYSLSHVKHISRGDIVNFFRKAVFRTFVITEKKSVITKGGQTRFMRQINGVAQRFDG